MRTLKKFLPVVLMALLLAGCAATFTNLTPQIQERNAATNQYPVEVALDCSQQSLRWDSIRPSIIVGNQSFPMHHTPLMTNRWEGYVPVPSGKATVRYHYKFDFDYNAFGKPQADSAVSPEYVLRIKDK
jgi:hypothetical protein